MEWGEREEREEREQRDEREEGEEGERESERGESFITWGPEYQFPELCCAWRMLSSARTCRGQLFAFGFVAPIRLS